MAQYLVCVITATRQWTNNNTIDQQQHHQPHQQQQQQQLINNQPDILWNGERKEKWNENETNQI